MKQLYAITFHQLLYARIIVQFPALPNTYFISHMHIFNTF